MDLTGRQIFLYCGLHEASRCSTGWRESVAAVVPAFRVSIHVCSFNDGALARTAFSEHVPFLRPGHPSHIIYRPVHVSANKTLLCWLRMQRLDVPMVLQSGVTWLLYEHLKIKQRRNIYSETLELGFWASPLGCRIVTLPSACAVTLWWDRERDSRKTHTEERPMLFLLRSPAPPCSSLGKFPSLNSTPQSSTPALRRCYLKAHGWIESGKTFVGGARR